MSTFILILELIGTAAFAISGSIVGIKKNMDIFGVCILGLSTAVGGGLIRDIVLGDTPPVMFSDPKYAATGLIVCFLTLIPSARSLITRNETLLMIADAVGLGIFTASGAMKAFDGSNMFLAVFVGTVTAVGGGLLRDMMANERPYILTKHTYALASIAGGILFCLILPYAGRYASLLICSSFVLIIRILVSHYRWSLPKLEQE